MLGTAWHCLDVRTTLRLARCPIDLSLRTPFWCVRFDNVRLKAAYVLQLVAQFCVELFGSLQSLSLAGWLVEKQARLEESNARQS